MFYFEGGRRSSDSGTDISGHRDRIKKKERDNTRDLEEETYEDVMNREMASHDSGFFTPGIGSALGAPKKMTVEEKKKPTIRRKLVTENLSEQKLTHDFQNRKMASQHSELSKGLPGVGARKKEKVEKKEKKNKAITHRHDQNRDLSAGASSVVGTPGDRPVNGLSSMATLSDHINTIFKSECLTVMKDVLTTALEKVEALESKAAKRTIEYDTPAETLKKKRELSPASSVHSSMEAPSLVTITTVQQSGSAVGQYPVVPCPGTSDNHHPVDGNMFIQTENSVHVLHQYSSIVPVENCVFFEPAHAPEGSRSVTSVTSSQWRQQWMTIDNDRHSVVSGVSSHWRQHRTIDDDDSDSDNSGTKSPQSEKKSFFERQNLSNADDDAVLEDLSCNLLECSINGRSPRKTRKGSKSSEMYEMGSVKINLMSTRSYVGSPSDRRPIGHAASSPSRFQPASNANQSPIIRPPRLSLPATPPQAVYDAGARNCRCPRCGSVWTSELELEEHYFEHLLGNRCCAVGGCEYTCSSRNELRRHVRAAHLRKHTCRRCGKAYLMASTLERHLRQCLPCRQCPLCPSAGIDNDSLCDHVASAHGARQIACNRRPELRYYVCRECRFATSSRTVALDHCQRHILGEINLNITLCEICDLLFVTDDLHFLMHAVDDSFNRKSFQIVDFDWRVSLNARRQLESSLKKIQATKALKASIDEETSNVKSNVEESNTETNDIVAPKTETKLKSQEINNDDSLQEKNNNSDLNQNEFDVIDKRIETNLSLCRESIHKMQDLMQEIVDHMKEANKMKGPGQSKILVERPLEQQNTVEISQSSGNVDINQSLPSSATAEVQNENATLNEEASMVKTNFDESNFNVETSNIAPPSEINLESQVIINDKKVHVDSVEKNTCLQENNKQTFLDHTNELDKRGTVSKNQSPNTTQQEDVLESCTMKESVQSETLVERPLEQQNTVAMSLSNDNVDSNKSLSFSLATEAQNQHATLDAETSTAKNFEALHVKTNDIIALSNQMHLDQEACIDSVEENTSLQQTFVNHKVEENIDKIKYLVQEIKELMQEGNKMKGLEKSEILVELNKFHVTDNLIENDLSQFGENINNMQDLTHQYLDERGTVSKNQLPNTTQQEDVLEASTMKEPVQSETLVDRPLEQQNTVAMTLSNDNVDNNNQSLASSSTAEAQNQNGASHEGTPAAITTLEELNLEANNKIALPSEINFGSHVIINVNINVNKTGVDLVEENTSLQEDNIKILLDHTNELNTRRTAFKNQSPYTQQEDVLESSTMMEPEQQTTFIAESQANDNLDNNNQSLPSSSTAEVQYENAALYEATPTATTTLEELNVETTVIMASPNEVNLEIQAILNDTEARDDSVEEITSLQANNKVSSLALCNELIKSKSSTLGENLDQVPDSTDKNSAQCGTGSKNQLSNTIKEPVQNEILVEIPLEQQTTVEMNRSNDNVDNNNQSLPSSLAAEAHKQALDEETSTATDFIEFNVKTNDHDDEARIDSVEENTSLQQTYVNHTNKLNKSNLPKFEENIVKIKYLVQEIKELMQKANKMKGPVQNEILVKLNKFHVTEKLIETNLSQFGENINVMQDLIQKYLAQCGTVSKNQSPNTTQQEDVLEASTMKEPVQGETLVKRPMEQQTTVVAESQANDDVDNNNQSLPSSSTAEVQNENAALNEETPTDITNLDELNVETTHIMASPKEVNLEIQAIHKNQVPKDQSRNTTQQEHVLEANTIKEPVQNETLVGIPLEQQTLVEISPSNGNADINQSLPSSSTAEVQNQYVALNKEAITATSIFENLNLKTNDIIPLSSEKLKRQVIDINDEASGYSEEQNTWLILTKSRVNRSIELMQEINNLLQQVRNTKKDPVPVEILIKSPVAQQTTPKSSEFKDNMDNNSQSSDIIFSSTAQVLNPNVKLHLDEETPTAGSNFGDSNVETTDIVSSPNEVNLESHVIINHKEARDDSVKDNISLQENENELNKRETVSKNQSSNTTQQEDVLEPSTMKEPVQSETLVKRTLDQDATVAMNQSNDNVDNNGSPSSSLAIEAQNQNAALDEETSTATNLEVLNVKPNDTIALSNKMHHDQEACIDEHEPNSSRLRKNQNLSHYGTDSKNQLSNTTQQEDVFEANTLKDSELSETSLDRTLEQQTTVDMSQTNVNVDYNNQRFTSSLEAEVQNQISALDEETPYARSNFKDSNVNTKVKMASSNETHLESQVIANDKKSRHDSVEENISLQENNKQTFLDHTKENNEPNLAQNGTDSKTQLSNTTQHQHILEANVMKDPEQSKTLVERPLEQQTAVEISQISQSNDIVDNNESLPAVEKQNLNSALNEESSTAITNFEEPHTDTNQNTVKTGDVKTETQEDVVNDENLIRLNASESATINEAYKNNNETSTIETEGVEKSNSAGEPKFTASKLDGSAIVTENEQKCEVNKNQTKENKILIRYSQGKEEKNDEASINNNDGVKLAVSSIDINITISGTKNLAVTEEEANSQNVLDKAIQTCVEDAISSVSALEENNAIEVLKMSHDETTAKDTENSSSPNNETIVKGDLDKSQGETHTKESMSSGSPKEETIINDVISDKGEDQISIEITKTLAKTTAKTCPEKVDQTVAEETEGLVATETIEKPQELIITPAELTVSSGCQTEASNTNVQTSSVENKTVARTTEERNTKEEVFVYAHGQTNAKETENVVVTSEETDTRKVLTENSPDDTTAKETKNSTSTINGNTIEKIKASDLTCADITTSPGSPTEECNSINSNTINVETKSSTSQEKTDSEGVSEEGQESGNQTSVNKTNSLEGTTKETDVKNDLLTTQELNRKEQRANRRRGRSNNNKKR